MLNIFNQSGKNITRLWLVQDCGKYKNIETKNKADLKNTYELK